MRLVCHSSNLQHMTLLGAAEVARRLKVSRPTVARMARDGRLVPTQKLDGLRGAFLFDSETVEAAAAERGR